MGKQLMVIAGNDKGRVFQLPEGGEPLAIGRGGSTATRLNDLRVSRTHCKVAVDGARVVISDCNSTVGTFVNEQKIAEHQLRSGDIIRIGDTELRFMDDDDVGEAATIAGDNLAAALTAAVPAVRPDVAKGESSSRQALAELVGTTQGQFDIEQIVAKGHSSTVFKARDTAEDRAVALKVYKPGFTKSDVEMNRFARGLAPVLNLQHPNLVSLYGAGKTGSYCWISMEYVEGENLAQLIQRVGMAGMLDWQHALRVAIHLCRGLEFVHKNKMIHRAIMPRNILIASSDKMAKLGALTQAQPMEGAAVKPTGKPAELLRDVVFMPPERVKDESVGDVRSDLYCLGASIYCMVTGRAPFEGKTLPETIAKILQGEPAGLKEFQLSLPDFFERVVLRLLQKKPENRYQTPGEVLADLEKIAKGQGSGVGNGRADDTADAEGVISVTCKCGRKLQARDKFAGTRVRCPNCGSLMMLPGQSTIGKGLERPATLPDLPEGAAAPDDDTATPPRGKGPTRPLPVQPRPSAAKNRTAQMRRFILVAAVLVALLVVLTGLAFLGVVLTKH